MKEKLFESNKEMPEEVLRKKVNPIPRLSNHWIPFLIYGPVVLAIFCYSFLVLDFSLLSFFLWFILAPPLWTIFEYFSHKYVLHAKPRSGFWSKLLYSVHTGHHDYPNDNRFVLVGLEVSVPALFIFYFLTYLILGEMAHAFMAGWVSTYLFYDWLHFAAHNSNYNNRLFQLYKRHHLDHHFIDNEKNFGFISMLWDDLFRTRISKAEKKIRRQLSRK